MSLPVALLLSLALHAMMIVAPIWLVAKPRPPAASIEARLMPLPTPAAVAAALGTEASAGVDAAQPQPSAPRALRGSSLRRARTMFSEHLFYPPEAVRRGLEGEVILLLTLTDSGRLVSAEIARSSGHALLDEAALDAAARIGALPGNPRQILFPVSFRLR